MVAVSAYCFAVAAAAAVVVVSLLGGGCFYGDTQQVLNEGLQLKNAYQNVLLLLLL